MHAEKIEAENFKGLVRITIEPEGNVVRVRGKNGQGKTSAIDIVWAVLQHPEWKKSNPRPIRDGEESAWAEVTLEDLVVRRTWDRDGGKSELEVRDRQTGKKKRAGATLLKSLIGSVSLDPGAFLRLDPKGQRELLLGLVDLPFDLLELEGRRQDAYDDRRELGRELKRIEGHLAEMPKPPKGTPAEEVSVADLAEEHDLAKRKHRRARDLNEAVKRAHANRDKALAELAAAAANRDQADKDVAAAVVAVQKIPEDLGDPDEVLRRISSAEEVNAAVRLGKDRAAAAKKLEEAREEHQDMEAALAAIDKEKTDGIAAAEMPVEGLGFGDVGVTFRGVPFVQCSEAEKVRVCVGISMKLHPGFKAIRVTQGSLLDEESTAALEEIAAENQLQVWLELVGKGDGVGYLIEAGSLAAVDGVPCG